MPASMQHPSGLRTDKNDVGAEIAIAVDARELGLNFLQATHRINVLTDILGGWVWETDTEHRFSYLSPSVAKFAGRPAEWHYGKTRQELGNLSVATIDGQSWASQLEAHQPFGPVDFVRYQHGEAFLMRAIGRPQFDASGEFTGYCGVAFAVNGEVDLKPAERRKSDRRRVVRAAEISCPGDATKVSCVLLDISVTGARLGVPADIELPKQFSLSVTALSLETRCELRWRRNHEVGVAFEA